MNLIDDPHFEKGKSLSIGMVFLGTLVLVFLLIISIFYLIISKRERNLRDTVVSTLSLINHILFCVIVFLGILNIIDHSDNIEKATQIVVSYLLAISLIKLTLTREYDISQGGI
ncbi:MAG: hypothetical protein INQ03_26025 [Candidatus Heimdallarchaeota archaeon]|nr:hypothetical protein [Candidatus Heimdallarchaeota archaeon]